MNVAQGQAAAVPMYADEFGEGGGMSSFDGMDPDLQAGVAYAPPEQVASAGVAAPVAWAPQTQAQAQGHVDPTAAPLGAPLAPGEESAAMAAAAAAGAPEVAGVAPEASAMAAAAKAPGRMTRLVTYTLNASLADMADGTTAAELSLSEDMAKQALPNGEKAVLYGARVVALNNGFSNAYHLTIEGADDEHVAASSSADCGHGKLCQGHLLVNADANQMFGETGMTLLQGNGDRVDEMPFRKQFPNVTMENLMNGISFHGDGNGKHALVDFDHPVIAYFNFRLASQNKPMLTKDQCVTGTNSFPARADAVETCLDEIRKGLRGNTIDLTKIKFKLSRVFGPIADGEDAPAMDDTAEFASKFASVSNRDKAVSTPKQLSITVAYDYRCE